MKHRFVEHVPEFVEADTIYISIEYAIAVHRCFCGCGNEVVTPLSPVDWSLTFDGETISLHPSIGNWSFACKSHYWIKKSKVHWAEKFTDLEIKGVQSKDKKDKTKHYETKFTPANKGSLRPKDSKPKKLKDRIRNIFAK
jgi:hypothetical protein